MRRAQGSLPLTSLSLPTPRAPRPTPHAPHNAAWRAARLSSPPPASSWRCSPAPSAGVLSVGRAWLQRRRAEGVRGLSEGRGQPTVHAARQAG